MTDDRYRQLFLKWVSNQRYMSPIELQKMAEYSMTIKAREFFMADFDAAFCCFPAGPKPPYGEIRYTRLVLFSEN